MRNWLTILLLFILSICSINLILPQKYNDFKNCLNQSNYTQNHTNGGKYHNISIIETCNDKSIIKNKFAFICSLIIFEVIIFLIPVIAVQIYHDQFYRYDTAT